MSVFSALSFGVSGMRAQSSRLAALSNNIANTSTNGYRRSDVDFASLVTSGGTGQAIPSVGGVQSLGRTDVARSGAIEGTTTNTDLAVRGDGFFLVDNVNAEGAPALTRAGNFRVDADGRLVNSNGYALMGARLGDDGLPLAPMTDAANLDVINVGNINFTGAPTTQVSYTGNLPSGATGPTGTGEAETSSVTVFDELGTARNLTMEWQPSGVNDNEWTLNLSDNGVAVGSVTVTFDATGATAGAPAGYTDLGVPAALAINNGVITVPVNGGAQTVELDLGAPGSYSGLTQFDGEFGAQTTRDGAGFGAFSGIEVNDAGVIFASFDNGERRAVYQIPIARSSNDNALNAVDGSAFEQTAASGDLRLSAAGENGTGSISAYALERSNVDIAEELTALIETQNAYSSAATVVQTADQMLQEAARLKR